MAVKSFDLQSVGTIHVYKRKGTKSLRLSIASDGKVRVTVPSWATYSDALRFVNSKTAWIQNNLPEKQGMLRSGLHIGKAHRLVFESSDDTAVRTRIAGSEIRIIRPTALSITDAAVQQAAHKACIRALRTEAQKLLPVRLKQLAVKYEFEYNSVQVKQLKGRWGSCDTHKHITLNLFLMQLPWHLIDYVLLHELTHTKHLNHSEAFWNEFLRHEPRAKQYRKAIRTHKPVLESEPI
jgi:predicted metal-dependent hydrolase